MAVSWRGAGTPVYPSGSWPSTFTVPPTAAPSGLRNGDTLVMVITAYWEDPTASTDDVLWNLGGLEFDPEIEQFRAHTWGFAHQTRPIIGAPGVSRPVQYRVGTRYWGMWVYTNVHPYRPPTTTTPTWPALPATMFAYKRNTPLVHLTPTVGQFRVQLFAIRATRYLLCTYESGYNYTRGDLAPLPASAPPITNSTVRDVVFTSRPWSPGDDRMLTREVGFPPPAPTNEAIALAFASCPNGEDLQNHALGDWSHLYRHDPISGHGGALLAAWKAPMTANLPLPQYDFGTWGGVIPLVWVGQLWPNQNPNGDWWPPPSSGGWMLGLGR